MNNKNNRDKPMNHDSPPDKAIIFLSLFSINRNVAVGSLVDIREIASANAIDSMTGTEIAPNNKSWEGIV